MLLLDCKVKWRIMYMKLIWFFLLMLPLFCIGDTEDANVNSAPILSQNPEYSAPAEKNQPKPATAPSVDRDTPPSDSAESSVMNQDDKPDPAEQRIADRKNSSVKTERSMTGNQSKNYSRPVAVSLRISPDPLERWMASHSPVPTALPRVTNFRPASSSYRRSSGYRTICRKKSSSCRTVKTCSSCSRSSCKSR